MQHPQKVRPRRSRTRLLAALTCAGVALAAAALLLLPAIRERFPATANIPVPSASAARVLFTGNAEDLDTISIRPADGDAYTLRMQDGHLQLSRNGEWVAISERQEENLLNVVTTLTAHAVVSEDADEVADQLSDMGLDTPRASAEVRFLDGSGYTLELGDTAPGMAYDYFRWSGGEGVYLCDSGVSDALTTTAARLVPVTQPVLSMGLIDQATLSFADETLAISFAADGEGHYAASLTRPWRYPLSAEQAETLLAALASLRLGTHEAEANDETRAAYGLDEPDLTLWLHQSAGTVSAVDESGQLTAAEVEEQTLQFVFGRPEGDFFYTCEYEGDCYMVSVFLLETLLSASPESLATRQPADMGGAALADVLIESPAGEVHVTAEYTERVLPNNDIETDAEGNIVYDTSVTLNGETADAELITSLTSRLNAFSVSGDLPDGWTVPKDEAPRWRIVLTTAGGTQREIAAYRLDALSDAIAVDGVALHYAHAEAIDLILSDLAS